MNYVKLNLAEIILSLRHKKGVTQEELAEFLGVTKASVSKWETKQSYPDILLLPQLAAYFNISIDDLLGYEPQLSKEQIRKLYHELAEDFSAKPFDDVMDRSRMLVKEYYSCFLFQYHMAILWMNHVILVPEQEKQKVIIKEIITLCNHIKNNCSEVTLIEDAIGLGSMANLQLGNAKEVIEELLPLNDAMRIDPQTVECLIKAYEMIGDLKQADYYNQIVLFTSLIRLVTQSNELLILHLDDYEYCLKTLQRVKGLIELYDLVELHPNIIANFYYHAAICYATHDKENKVLEELQNFTKTCVILLDQDLKLHGDSYFTTIDHWIQNYTLGSEGVRTAKLVMESIISAFDHPLFIKLSIYQDILQLKQQIRKKMK